MAERIGCEEFERDYAEWSSGGLSAERQLALEKHGQSCWHCGAYRPETARLRGILAALPQMAVSPQFAYRLQRSVRELESGVNSKWSWQPRVAPAALSAGFAAAIVVGFLLLRPSTPPNNMIASQPTSGKGPNEVLVQESHNPTSLRPSATPQTAFESLALNEEKLDTAKHRLPEAPGHQQIPLPVEDDLWRLNQASTTPSSP
jgi:hypothetical protein